ncbi:MAG: division/cell wall cluster transcriptional repressor MraZ [Planctomycetota bacterium]
MLFTGEYEHTVDAKQRVAIPAEIRALIDPEVHGAGFYVAPGPTDNALSIWPQKTFERMAARMDPSLLPAEDMLPFERLMFSQARLLVPDKAGRVRLPERLLKLIGVEQAIVILGVKDHLELLAPSAWEEERDQNLAKHSEIVLRARRAQEEQRRGESE